MISYVQNVKVPAENYMVVWAFIALLATCLYWGIAFLIGYFLSIPIIILALSAYSFFLVKEGTFDWRLAQAKAWDVLDAAYWLSPIAVTCLTATYVRGYWNFQGLSSGLKTLFLR